MNVTDQNSKSSPASRPPAAIRQAGNHLKEAPSLYLRQHAFNPVDWYPWGDEALSRARKEGKLVFLSIGYASCHWCHVMEKEVFEQEDVAEFLNQHFISIKVDREERPDLDASYMSALLAMTGSGGWPMSMFLTPDLKPFFGRTYLPRAQFIMLARRLNQLFHEDGTGVKATAEEIARWLTARSKPAAGEALDQGAFAQAAHRAAQDFDEQWGGTRGGMKFPTPPRWRALLHHFRKTGEERWGKMVRTTLDALGSGGVHDQVGGGFHRYAVEETWMIPHFEKMLYDNAQLASLFFEAGATFNEPRYIEIGKRTLEFMLREMTDPAGGFYASLDADSEGQEGIFYLWTPEEMSRVVGSKDGPPLAMLLGATAAGNFEGKNVLSRRQPLETVATHFLLDPSQVTQLWDRRQSELLEWRDKRERPTLDKKMVTAWNGMALAAFAQGYRLLKDQRFRVAAESAAEFLWRHHRRGEGARLFRVSNAGHAAEEGILDDYAFFAAGLLELYQATGEVRYLRQARELTDFVLAEFRQSPGGFFLTPQDLPSPFGRQVEILDSVQPSAASVMLHILLSLAQLTGKNEYLAAVDEVLTAHGSQLRAAGLEMAGWFDAAEKRQGPLVVVIIVEGAEKAQTGALANVVNKMMPSHALLVIIPPQGADQQLVAQIPSAAGKSTLNGQTTAYVCTLGTCKRPTTDAQELRRQILEDWTR